MKKNRRVSTFLASILISGMISSQVFAADTTGHWAEKTMNEWQTDGLLTGDQNGELHPDQSITRAEFVSFANRALGFTEKSKDVEKYKDVEKNAWYYEDVAKAVAAKYINGTSNDSMSPMQAITNEQAYTIIAQIAKEEETIDLNKIADHEKISDWAKQNVAKIIASGYIIGDHQQIHPKNNMSRAQAITILDRYKNEDRIFAYPGTYSFKSARNVTILCDGITFKSGTIKGNLTLGAEVKEFKQGNLIINGQLIKKNPKTTIDTTENTTKIQESTPWKDGLYEGLAEGENGPIRVQIDIAKGKIRGIYILEHKENNESLEKMKKVIRQIIENGNLENMQLGEDTTINSQGILNAVKDAISQSSGKTVKVGESEAAQAYKILIDGTYEGEGQGYGGTIRVKIQVKNGKITDIQILENQETSGYLERTYIMRDNIIKKGNLDDIDTVSGATISSKGILNAIRDAMSQARGKTKKVGETQASNQYNGGGSSGGGNHATEPNKIDFSKKTLKDGEYKGKAIGYGGAIHVTVTVEKGVIAKVTVDSHRETSSYYDRAKEIVERIAQKNSTNVDTVSRATVTSKGILSAVEDALSKAKGSDLKKKEYADGTWYGQGRGLYPRDRYDFGQLKTATEAKVVIKEGKIVDVELVYHGDDEDYKRPDGYRLIKNRIMKNAGTEGLAEIFAKQDRSEQIYDAISGATFSARGYVNAIDDALNRSIKFKKDHIEQEVRSVNLKKKPSIEVYYGKELSLKDFEVNVKYLDGRSEDVSFEHLGEKGIRCNLPMVFTPEPIDKNHYDDRRDYELTFIHDKSTSKHSSEIQASREIQKKWISKIVFETEDGKRHEVKTNEKDFRYNIELSEFKKISKVEAFNSDSTPAVVKKFEVKQYKAPTLLVELEQLDKKPTDEVITQYGSTNYSVEMKINAEFDKDKIIGFDIISPRKLAYEVGDTLDLSGLKINARDSNYVKKTIDFSTMEDNGFTASPEHGSELNQKGTIEVTIKNGGVQADSQSFTIEVGEEKKAGKVIFMTEDGEVVVPLPDTETKYEVSLPKVYQTTQPDIYIYNGSEEEIEPYKIKFVKGYAPTNKPAYFQVVFDENYERVIYITIRIKE